MNSPPWNGSPVVTSAIAIAGAVILLAVTHRLYGSQTRSTRPTRWAIPRIRIPQTASDYLFWLAGLSITAAALWTIAVGSLTGGSALLVLGGTIILIWAIFRTQRRDSVHWATWFLIVGGFLSMLLPFIRR